MNDIILRSAKTTDAKQIAHIKIEGWKTTYKGIVDDDYLR